MQLPCRKKKKWQSFIKPFSYKRNLHSSSLFLSKKLHSAWLQKRPFRLFSHSLDFARKYGNVTDIRFLLLPRPVTSQHDFRHRFASRFTVRSHANRFLTSLRASWINLNRSFTCSDSDSNAFSNFTILRQLSSHRIVRGEQRKRKRWRIRRSLIF